MRERRRSKRVEEQLTIRCRASGDLGATGRSAVILNFSAAGARLRSAEPLEAGAQVRLTVQLPGRKEPFELTGLVAWSTVQAPEVAEHGIEFMDLTPNQQASIEQLVMFLARGV